MASKTDMLDDSLNFPRLLTFTSMMLVHTSEQNLTISLLWPNYLRMVPSGRERMFSSWGRVAMI